MALINAAPARVMYEKLICESDRGYTNSMVLRWNVVRIVIK